MAERRTFDVPGKYALSLRNLLGGTFDPSKAFFDKYMAIGSVLGQKRYVNEIIEFNKISGPLWLVEMKSFCSLRLKQGSNL